MRSCRWPTRVRPTVAAIDSADRAMRCLNESDWPLVAKLHGDYQSIAIKNTGSELEQQDIRMRHVLVEAGKGSEWSLSATADATPRSWRRLESSSTIHRRSQTACIGSPRRPRASCRQSAEFLDRAQAAGVDVAVVECATFDELAADIIKTTDLPQPLFDRVMEGRPSPRLVPVQLPTAEARLSLSSAILRFSSKRCRAPPGE